MTLMTRRRAIVAGALAAPMLAHRGWAQGVPFAAAGTTDLLRFAWKKMIEAAKLEP
jgi:hypothetical protein